MQTLREALLPGRFALLRFHMFCYHAGGKHWENPGFYKLDSLVLSLNPHTWANIILEYT